MRSLRAVAPLALTIGAVAVAPAGAAPADHGGPVAKAAGTDAVTLAYPSLVNNRVIRAQTQLQRAAFLVDSNDTAGAATALTAAQANMSAAWNAAQSIIANAPSPAPAAEEARAGKRSTKKGRRLRAHRSGLAAPLVDPTAMPASPADTGFLVLSLQHAAVTNAAGLLPGAAPEVATAATALMTQALNDRDLAVSYIQSVAPPAPAGAEEPAEEVVASTFDIVMPNLMPHIDDELLTLAVTTADATLPAEAATALQAAISQATATQSMINTVWPSIPAED